MAPSYVELERGTCWDCGYEGDIQILWIDRGDDSGA
jgi:hypothetical protein